MTRKNPLWNTSPLSFSLCENCSAKAMYYSWTCPECLTAEMQTKSFLKHSHIQHIQCMFKTLQNG